MDNDSESPDSAEATEGEHPDTAHTAQFDEQGSSGAENRSASVTPPPTAAQPNRKPRNRTLAWIAIAAGALAVAGAIFAGGLVVGKEFSDHRQEGRGYNSGTLESGGSEKGGSESDDDESETPSKQKSADTESEKSAPAKSDAGDSESPTQAPAPEPSAVTPAPVKPTNTATNTPAPAPSR